MDSHRATLGWFPRSPSNRSASEAPSSTPAASPRLRRRPSPWPPHRWNYTASELTTGHNPVRTSRAAHRPISTRLDPTSLLRSVNRWFTLVTPSGLAEQARTVWQSRHVPPLSGPLAALPGVPPGQAAPRLHPAAATAGRERSLTPPRSPRRLVAHNSAAKKLAADLKIWFARRSSRFSRSSRATRSASLDVVPGRSPASISARLPGMRCSVREMLTQLAGIGESVLTYPSTGGRPKARRMLTETTPEQDRLATVFGLGWLDQSAATRGWGLWLGVRTHRW